MRVLVTGGAGFIGANLLHHWAGAHPEDEITTLDALTYAGHLASIRPLLDSGQVTFVHGDIADPAVVREAIRGVETLVHLAAESHVDRSIESPAPFVRTNVVGTQVLLDAARAADLPRFHHVSTDEVFGSIPLGETDRRFTTTTPYDPRSPYSASKAAADHLVRAYHHTYGIPVTLSNCGNNYGPFQHPEKLIPKAITRLLNGQRVPLYGAGVNVRDWIQVGDHCRALDLIVQRGRPGQTYLIAGEGGHSNLDVTRMLLGILGLGEERVEYVADRPGHDLRYALDPSPNLLELGWRPRVALGSGLRATVDWYRARRDWWEPLVAGGPTGR